MNQRTCLHQSALTYKYKFCTLCGVEMATVPQAWTCCDTQWTMWQDYCGHCGRSQANAIRTGAGEVVGGIVVEDE